MYRVFYVITYTISGGIQQIGRNSAVAVSGRHVWANDRCRLWIMEKIKKARVCESNPCFFEIMVHID